MTDHLLGPFIRRFLLEYLVADRNLSRNTQRSYRDAIRLLLLHMQERHGLEPTRVAVEQVTVDVVRGFLAALEERPHPSCDATRNQRLAAVHSLFRFIGSEVPELVAQAAQIRSIPRRRTPVPVMAYLDKPEIDAMLAVPDRQRELGRRDYSLLLFLYNTGARASEAAAVTIGDIELAPGSSVRLFGKGRKARVCPLWKHTTDVLKALIGPRVDGPSSAPVFLNVRGQPITRFGIHDLVSRVARAAAHEAPTLRSKRVSPHTLRHTTAVHLLRAGVDINTIRAWLGHVSLETTNRYAEIDTEMKARALEMCAVRGSAPAVGASDWRKKPDILAFLAAL